MPYIVLRISFEGPIMALKLITGLNLDFFKNSNIVNFSVIIEYISD